MTYTKNNTRNKNTTRPRGNNKLYPPRNAGNGKKWVWDTNNTSWTLVDIGIKTSNNSKKKKRKHSPNARRPKVCNKPSLISRFFGYLSDVTK